jgi:hypothetical protein
MLQSFKLSYLAFVFTACENPIIEAVFSQEVHWYVRALN